METINTQFTDSFGNLLSLNEGQSSVVHFHLKEKDKNMDHELTHVRIDSQVDTKLNYENTNSSFWVHLKHPINLNQNAKIALMDISFPNTICSIPESIGKKSNYYQCVSNPRRVKKTRCGNTKTLFLQL